MILIVISTTKMRASRSLMKMLLLITPYILKMYLNLSILVPCTCLFPSQEWHACTWGQWRIYLHYPSFLKGPIADYIRQRPSSGCNIQELDDDLEPSQFFYYARSVHYMIKRMEYNLNHGAGLNFGKGRHILLQPFIAERKPASYYNRTRRGLGYVTVGPKAHHSTFDDDQLM